MRIGFIGVGNMGYALLTAAMKGEGNEVLVYDKDTKKAEAAAERTGAAVADVKTVARECELVLLGVKPDIIPHVIAEIKSDIGKDTVLVSMAAGVKIGSIEGMLGTDGIGVIRIMPNLAAAIGEGVVL